MRSIIAILLAAALCPLGSVAPASAAISSRSAATFHCRGLGRGVHARPKTEAECVRLGGRVEREPMREAPAPLRSDFSCRGIGKGHHAKHMTRSQCVRMGGTVIERR